MSVGRYLRFAISVIACASALYLFSFDEQRVALLRLGNQLKSEGSLQTEIMNHCSSLRPVTDSIYEKFFAQRLGSSGLSTDKPLCNLRIEAAHRSHFNLREHWVFTTQIQSVTGSLSLQKSLHIDFPKPLVLLPFAIFLLMLLFDRTWRYSWLLGLFLFMVGGGNLVRLGELVGKSVFVTFRSDQTFLALSLMLLWTSLLRSSPLSPAPRTTKRNFGRALTYLVGFWSPIVYTVLGRLIFPLRRGLSRTLPFLSSQAFIACLSLYFFSLDFHNYSVMLGRSALLPRYFSYAILLFYFFNLWIRHSPDQRFLWQLPRFWRGLLFVIAMEGLTLFVPRLGHLTTLTRVGAALVLSELVWPSEVLVTEWARHFFPWWGAAFLASFIPVLSQEGGVVDLVLTLCDPRLHPVGQSFFSFLAGLFLGFCTGSFPATFFAFFGLMMKTTDVTLVRGALLDGILAGSLLSPISIYNLLPAVQFGIRLQDLVATRFRQLSFPLIIGASVYLVGSLNSVKILQPVTFVFLCLVAFALQLKNRNWIFKRVNVDKFSITAHSGVS